MRKFSFIAALCAAGYFLSGCNASSHPETPKNDTTATAPVANHANLKAEIQALDDQWAAADNARDVKTIANFYAEDAVSMPDDHPMDVGRAAIQKTIEGYTGRKLPGTQTSYEAMDVFGGGNYATETGKIIFKDSTGKVYYTGKYMTLWEKRDGKWTCIRDISNDDAPEKK